MHCLPICGCRHEFALTHKQPKVTCMLSLGSEVLQAANVAASRIEAAADAWAEVPGHQLCGVSA